MPWLNGLVASYGEEERDSKWKQSEGTLYGCTEYVVTRENVQ